jgi:acyl-CoA synthetase (AMP-forming)/AMP-acid ligase II
LLAHAAATRGETPAIHDADVVVTWAELERIARRAAAAYIAAGVEPGDRVAIWAPNVWEWIPAAFVLSRVRRLLPAEPDVRVLRTQLGAADAPVLPGSDPA